MWGKRCVPNFGTAPAFKGEKFTQLGVYAKKL